MRRAGQVAIGRFPTVALSPGKPRPVVLLARVPGAYEDWQVCMVSSQLERGVQGFAEVVDPGHDDFDASGLRVASVIRVGRLAVVPVDVLIGAIGEIGAARLRRVRAALAEWIQGAWVAS